MLNQNEQDAVAQKTRELCETVLNQPSLVAARQRIDAFLEDQSARAKYQSLVAKGQALQEKQQMAMELSDEEIAAFEAQRNEVLSNPVAKGFLDAQEEFQSIRHSITKHVSMTLETGKVPTEADMQEATCGHGCNCH
jgi:cell fate (sporulation/competence/biofilm development) regulator YlbF (YheA/YmcA/DUF963 family)